MPAFSEKQRRAAGIAYAAKKGDIPASKLKGASKSMAEGMTKKQLRDFSKKKMHNPSERVLQKKPLWEC